MKKTILILTAILILLMVLFSGYIYLADRNKNIRSEFIDLVKVPGGRIILGWTGIANPLHKVSVKTFYMAKYEVTYGLWTKVKDWAVAHDASAYPFINEGKKGNDNSPEKTNLHPVTAVCWYDVVLWCNALSEMSGLSKVYMIDDMSADANNNNLSDPYKWRVTADWSATGYRLPTEAEWEYAARFINGFSWRPGDQWSGDKTADTVSWYTGNAMGTTHERGADKRPGKDSANSLGIYDMSGNVQEWCWDWYAAYGNFPESDPRGPLTGSRRIFRGGSWGFNSYYCKISVRNDFNPSQADDLFGFRVVKKGF
jgi:formylglycine-generating enzyme